MDGTMIWSIKCSTKHGTDIALVKQDSEPTSEQIKQLEKKWRKGLGIAKNDDDFYVQIYGCIDSRSVPYLDEYIKQKEI